MPNYAGQPARKTVTRMCQSEGFTLAEVIITISIIGIAMAIAIPSFLTWLPNLHFRDASRNMLFDMNLARTTAMKRNVNVSVMFDEASSSCSSLTQGNFPDSGGSYSILSTDNNGNTETIKIVRMPTHVALCGSTFSGDLIFQPTGLPDMAALGSVTIKNDRTMQSALEVNLTGRIALN